MNKANSIVEPRNKRISRGPRTTDKKNRDSLSVYYANCLSVINKINYLKH